MSTDALPPQSNLTAIARVEWQTIALVVAIYGGFLALTWFWQSLPIVLVIGLGGWLIAWHGSLQHEVIHGHPTRNQRINDAIGGRRCLSGCPMRSIWKATSSTIATNI